MFFTSTAVLKYYNFFCSRGICWKNFGIIFFSKLKYYGKFGSPVSCSNADSRMIIFFSRRYIHVANLFFEYSNWTWSAFGETFWTLCTVTNFTYQNWFYILSFGKWVSCPSVPSPCKLEQRFTYLTSGEIDWNRLVLVRR